MPFYRKKMLSFGPKTESQVDSHPSGGGGGGGGISVNFFGDTDSVSSFSQFP